MAGPERPTVPPPRRRSEDRDRRDTPPSTSSDSRELVLRELRDVEERAQSAISELSGVFERRIADLESQLAERDDTIARLQRADTDALLDHAKLGEAVAAMGRRLSAELSTSVAGEVSRQLESRAAAEGAEAGATAGKAAGSRAGARWTPVAGFLGAVIAAAVSAGAQRCSGEDGPPKPTVTVPAPGPGYGGRH